MGAGLFLALHLFVVEFLKQRPQCLIDVLEAEELSVAQGGEQPLLDALHRRFDLGLIAALDDSGGQDGASIVGGHLFVGALDVGSLYRMLKMNQSKVSRRT